VRALNHHVATMVLPSTVTDGLSAELFLLCSARWTGFTVGYHWIECSTFADLVFEVQRILHL